MQRSNSAEGAEEEANALKLWGLWDGLLENLMRWADLQHCRILRQLIYFVLLAEFFIF